MLVRFGLQLSLCSTHYFLWIRGCAWSSCGGLMFQEIIDLKGDKRNLEEEVKKLKE